MPFKSYVLEKRSVLKLNRCYVAPSNHRRITLLTQCEFAFSSPFPTPVSSLFFLSPFLPLFIPVLYPPSLPRAYLDARLKIDPVTASGDILKAERSSERASERISASVNERMHDLGWWRLLGTTFRPFDSSAADPPVSLCSRLRGSVGTSPSEVFLYGMPVLQ